NGFPAQNSVGEVDNVYVSFMFNGIYLNRPITSTVYHGTVVQSQQDGIVFQGDGTSTWCIQCYVNFSGRNNFSIWGMNYSGVIGGASDNATMDGYHVDDCENNGASCPGGNTQSINITINAGAEQSCQSRDPSCAGIKLVDALESTINAKVLNSKGYGIWLNGARGTNISGNISTSTRNDLQVDCLATPQCGGGTTLSSLAYLTSGGGQLNSGLTVMGYSNSASLFLTSNPLQMIEGSAPAGVVNQDILYGDSTAHRWKMLNNNGTADTVIGAATTDILTKKTIGDALTAGGTAARLSGTGACTTIAT